MTVGYSGFHKQNAASVSWGKQWTAEMNNVN